MKTLKLNLDYKINYGETKPESIDEAYAKLSVSYLEYAVTSAYKDGVGGTIRRILSKLQTKTEQAIEDKTYSMELEDKEIKFLKDLFKNEKTIMPALISKYVTVLEDEIFGL